VIAALEQAGWRQIRQKRSHRQYGHSDLPGTITVPGKLSDTLKAGTLASGQAGVRTRGAALTEYLVIYEPGDDNWSAYAPDLPGCVTTGADRKETEANMREAIALHVLALREAGVELPAPLGEAGYLRA
jgi:predicted RNase H-like HicB family nuclease/predicted RNA binding protein YcfA (HicA-like mRNA interferase family)